MQYKLKPNIALRTPAEMVILIFYISHNYDLKLRQLIISLRPVTAHLGSIGNTLASHIRKINNIP